MNINDEQDYLKEKSDIAAVISLFKYGKKVRKYLVLSIFLIILASVSLMFSAKMLGDLIELLIQKDFAESTLWFLVTVILTLELLNVVLVYFGRIGLGFVTNRVAFEIRCALFSKLTRLPISYFDKEPLGRTITRLTNDIEGIESFFTSTLARVFTAIISITSVMIAMLVTNFYFGKIIVLSSIPALIFTYVTRKPVRKWMRAYKSRSAILNSQLAEFINGLPVIKIFNLENWSYKKFDGLNRNLLRSALNLMNLNSVIRPFSVFLCSFPILIILWWGGQLVFEGILSVGLIVSFVRYAERFSGPIIALTQEIHVIQDALSSSERVNRMLNEIEETDTLGVNGTVKQRIIGNIEFSNVSMEYEKNKPILKNVSFHVNRGQKIGLVGRSGSGKTTTISLLPLLYPVSEGSIKIDGIPLEQWDRLELRKQIGIVSQNVVIFRGTLRENLLISSEEKDIPDEKIIEACKSTGLIEIINSMERGLDTYLVEGGENLSMGERQLLVFTRMLIRNPAILILDEATSNIDEKCENLVQEAIKNVLANRTCFIIAHRLNTILQCDQILVFKDGQVCEKGEHKELMLKGGYYRKLAEKQMEHSAKSLAAPII